MMSRQNANRRFGEVTVNISKRIDVIYSPTVNLSDIFLQCDEETNFVIYIYTIFSEQKEKKKKEKKESVMYRDIVSA